MSVARSPQVQRCFDAMMEQLREQTRGELRPAIERAKQLAEILAKAKTRQDAIAEASPVKFTRLRHMW